MTINKYEIPVEPRATLVEHMHFLASFHPEGIAFIYVSDGEGDANEMSYFELDRLARCIAARLQEGGYAGERALLLFPPGPEFIAAFLGCLYAGVVAVPAYPPRDNHNAQRLHGIATDAEARVILTTAQQKGVIMQRMVFGEAACLPVLASDTMKSGDDSWQEPALNARSIAFIQYTSGSTGKPKGVMVTHANIMHNEKTIQKAFVHSRKTVLIGWLPMFHDMGLIGNLLQPLVVGFPAVFFSPLVFLQKPLLWLQLISKYRATISGAPNFAYEHCLNRITPEQKAGLDLSSWDLAFCGAEPVRAETLERFAAEFACCGFRAEAFYPCYGMAEATLFISGGEKSALPVFLEVRPQALEQNRVELAGGSEESRRLVGCGRGWLDQKIVIAKPRTLARCSEDEVGEICVSGQSVASGYWRRPQETAETFACYLADGEGPFLRTGDLGFLRDGELYVTGRCKDLIIIRGRNHYPQDVELTVEESHRALRAGGGAAFSVDLDGEERLVVVQEVERSALRSPDLGEIFAAVRGAIARNHELAVEAIVLIKPASLPKTSSGKIQRHGCRSAFLGETLSTVGQWRQGDERDAGQKADYLAPRNDTEELLAGIWCTHFSLERVGVRDNVFELGGYSLILAKMLHDIQEALGVQLTIENLYESPTIEELAHLIESKSDAVAEPVPPRTAIRRRRGSLLSILRHDYFLLMVALFHVPAVLLTLWYLVKKKAGREDEKLRERGPRFIARSLLFLNRVKVNVRGMENLAKVPDGPVIMFCNHKSHIDAYVTLAKLPFFHKCFNSDNTHITRGKLKVLGWIERTFDLSFLHSKKDPWSTEREFARARDYLLAGNRLLLHPEGRVVPEGVGEFGDACGRLAIETNAWVIPVALINTEHAYETNGHLYRSARVEMIIGTPLDPSGYEISASKDFTALTRSSMLDLVMPAA